MNVMTMTLASNKALEYFLPFWKSNPNYRQANHALLYKRFSNTIILQSLIKYERLTEIWKTADLQATISVLIPRALLSSLGCRWVIYNTDRAISLVTMRQAGLTNRQESKAVCRLPQHGDDGSLGGLPVKGELFACKGCHCFLYSQHRSPTAAHLPNF